jgi:prepilin-type N-terminal cleavage/methylation domain-containing protein
MSGAAPHADESGFTLVELLVAMTVGLLILFAAFFLLDYSTSLSKEIADRQDGVQRGRRAMEDMTRQLRSQVCLGDVTEPIKYGDDRAVTFYADLSDGSRNVEQRTLVYDGGARAIVEQVHPGSGTYPDLTFAATPATTRGLLENALPAVEGGAPQPLFSYFAYREGGVPGDLEQLPVPLSATDASRVVMIKIGFTALPAQAQARDDDATTFYSDVYVRLADPARPAEGPRCL